ncbi:hypothetical protein Tco_0950312 [Tanacetum coccineum]
MDISSSNLTITSSIDSRDFFFRATNESGIPYFFRIDRKDFVNYVAYSMAKFLTQSTSVHKFNFVTELKDGREVYVLDKCLGFILRRGVKVLVVNIGESYLDPRLLYHLPNRLSSASVLTSLTICGCVLR